MSVYTCSGTLMQGSGGLYLVKLDKSGSPLSGCAVRLRARGNMRRAGLLVGDRVDGEYTDSSFVLAGGMTAVADDSSGLPDGAITLVHPRKNRLIRPAMANLDNLFIVCAAQSPDPDLLMTDKLLSVCEYYGILPAVVITKYDLNPENALKIREIYRNAGYDAFALSCLENTGIDEFEDYITGCCRGRISAFTGVSGAGKSTLMSRLFPSLRLEAGEISGKTGRGRHTTRRVDLFVIDDEDGEALIADTPGFSFIDFENFDFLPFEALADTMKDFIPYYPDCRYPDCTHTKEKECGVAQAVRAGRISPSRHESYLAMYESLKKREKNKYS